MCSDTLDPGGEVRGCSMGCTIAMSDTFREGPARRSIERVSTNKKVFSDVGVFWMRWDSFVF